MMMSKSLFSLQRRAVFSQERRAVVLLQVLLVVVLMVRGVLGVAVLTDVPKIEWNLGDGRGEASPSRNAESLQYFTSSLLPHIIQHAPSATWPAMRLWTPDYMSEMAEANGTVSGSSVLAKLGQADHAGSARADQDASGQEHSHSHGKDGNSDQQTQSGKKRFGWGCCKVQRLPMREFFERVERGESLYYSGPLDTLPSQLRRDIGDLSIFDSSAEIQHPDLGEPESGMQSILWMGGQGATAPCHQDSMHNFFVQIYGRKRFVLYPPQEWRHLYLYPRFHLQHRNVQVDLSRPDESAKMFSKFRDLGEGFEAILEPGDVLYLPPLWFHEVEALSTSVSVNVWSPAFAIEKMNLAWEQNVPLDYVNWNREKLIAVTSYYVWTLADMVCGNNATEVLWDIVGTRYEMLAQSGDQSVTGHFHAATEIGVDGQVPELTSPESLQHRDYLARIRSEPPLVPDIADWHAEMEREQQDQEQKKKKNHADENDGDDSSKSTEQGSGEAARVTKDSDDGNDATKNDKEEKARSTATRHYAKACLPDLMQQHVSIHDLRQQLQENAERVASLFMNVPYGMAEVYLAHYIEDLVAHMFGEEEVYHLLKQCLLY